MRSTARPGSNQISDDAYGGTLSGYLDRASFAQPASGTFGDYVRNSLEGPGYWSVDLALSRLLSFGSRQGVELRVEVFNLLNNFNWGNPVTNFGSGQFGRITSQSGDPRVMQFGMKYSF
jgi:hypothetical protein